jgi:hypothetical protein
MDFSRLPHYILFLFLFIISITLSSWGQYVTLPYKDLSMWQAYKMAIPFVWIEWIILTYAIAFQDKYDLFTPTHIILLLMVTQFITVLIINKFYLKNSTYISDIVAFGIILLGFLISFFNIISKALNLPIDAEPYKNVNNNENDIENKNKKE